MKTELHGYNYSVYTWIARFALSEKGVEYSTVEVNPFTEAGHPAHPFGKVPLLVHDGFRVYETSAITRFIDSAFFGPQLQPTDMRERARSDQIISVVDNYAYWPFVRQVSSQGYLNKALGSEVDQAELQAGLKSAPKILSTLNDLVSDQGLLKAGLLSLGDIHLGPMISYFQMAPEGAKLLQSYPQLFRWWDALSAQQGLEQSKPNKLPRLS
ncbi:glutathione S-transferase family protein [Sphingorhabdus sp. EL138]|uniref:glutathione S-transferase family protein n=1 Tax=Sphingorhabdus sp. EL138 TaxID=2073156 RepID=UPI000D69F52B|nr:glutathione S-transferase family protein [Sphingorhabdus sp. EL138]